MFRFNFDNKQRFSLRKYKGIGAASVLLGLMALGGSDVEADFGYNRPWIQDLSRPTLSNFGFPVRSGGVENSGVRNNGDGTTTLYNEKGSYTLPTDNTVEEGAPMENFTEREYSIGQKNGELYVESRRASNESEIKNKIKEDINDVNISYVEKNNFENKLKDDTKDKVTADTLVRGRFGKRYEGTALTEENVYENLKAKDQTIEKESKIYHKIDVTLDKKDGTSKETTFKDINLRVTPKGLHNDDGSIRYGDIKDGTRLWLVSETDENKYDKYILVTKDDKTNDAVIKDTFKEGDEAAKSFSKENIEKDGGIKEGDIVLVVEREEYATFAVSDTAIEQWATTSVDAVSGKGFLANLANISELKKQFPATEWSKIYPKIQGLVSFSDEKRRPTYASIDKMIGVIREGDTRMAYNDNDSFIAALKEKYGDTTIVIDWNEKRDVAEPVLVDDINRIIETENYKEEKIYLDELTKALEKRKTIQYLEKMPEGATFVKNVFEVNVGFGEANADYVGYTGDVSSLKFGGKWFTYKEKGGPQAGIGQLYKEYQKDGQIYRVAAAMNDDHSATLERRANEFHYYTLYTPTRAYKVVNNELSKITNIYALEEREEVPEKKGSVVVHYKTVDGASVKDDVTLPEKIVSNMVTKYYFDKDNNKVIVENPTEVATNVAYDVSDKKEPTIEKEGLLYKLIEKNNGLKDGSASEKGKVAEGETTITYIYEQVKPTVTENFQNKLGTVIVRYVDDKGVEIKEVKIQENVVVQKGKQTSYPDYPKHANLTKVEYEATNAEYTTEGYKEQSLSHEGRVYSFKRLVPKEEVKNYVGTTRGEASDVEKGNVAEGVTIIVYQYDYLIPVDPTKPNDPTKPLLPTPGDKIPNDPKERTYKELALIKNIERKISYVYKNGPKKGEKAAEEVTQTVTFTREAMINRATGEVRYGNWSKENGQLEKIVSPKINNYKVDKEEVEALTVTPESNSSSIEVGYNLQTATKVIAKYMIEGTNTELKEGEVTQGTLISEDYEAKAPAAKDAIEKDGKTYVYKGHRQTSAPEKGKLSEQEQVVIYDYVERITKVEKLRSEKIPYKIERRLNPALEPGELRVIQEGKEGSKDFVRESTYEGGVLVSTGEEKEANVVNPINMIIEVGPAETAQPILKLTRHVIEGTNTEIASVEPEFTEAKQGIITFEGKQYKYVSTEETKELRTHYYKEVEKPKQELPKEEPPKREKPKEENTPKQEQPRQETPDVKESQEETQRETSQKILPKTTSATGNAVTQASLGMISLIGLAVRRRQKNK